MRHRMEGIIAAAGFASGDRVVVGHWSRSPVGALSDVMWAAGDGTRTLFAPTDAAATFITAVYDFDAVVVGPVSVAGDERRIEAVISSGGGHGGAGCGDDERRVDMSAGPGWNIPPRRRPAALTRWVEAPLARALMGVHTYGTSPRGVREWYQATAWRPVRSARASIGGRDLGALSPIHPPCRFGFSEAPRRPSITVVRPLLEDRSGRLDQTLATLH